MQQCTFLGCGETEGVCSACHYGSLFLIVWPDHVTPARASACKETLLTMMMTKTATIITSLQYISSFLIIKRMENIKFPAKAILGISLVRTQISYLLYILNSTFHMSSQYYMKFKSLNDVNNRKGSATGGTY